MKKILIILMLVSVLFSADTLQIRNYESADLNNFGGPVVENTTDVSHVIIAEYYLAIKGSSNSEDARSYTVSDYIQIGLNASFTLGDKIYGYYYYNEELIIVDLNEHKFEIFIF